MQFEFSSELPVSAAEAYAWHLRPGALERLIPPWESVRLVDRGFENGPVILEAGIGPMRTRWVARHREVVPGRQFVDEQVEGPFERWVHTHLFEPIGNHTCRYVDRIVYRLPFGPVGALGQKVVNARLRRTFRYRHATVRGDLESAARAGEAAGLTVAITGASGLIGRSLIPLLTTAGHRVRRLVRGQAGGDDRSWDPSNRRIDPGAFDGVDAVIHLAGEPIAGRWTTERRRRIMDSRVDGTTFLAETLAGLARPPRILVAASGIGIYGDRGDRFVTEATDLRAGAQAMFVERVGQSWEAATGVAVAAGIRVSHVRLGVVLTPAGGALQRMLPPFRAGGGGRLGNGHQYMSWIGIDDVLGAIHHVLVDDRLRGPVNLTAPEPVTNAEFTATLAEVLGRPAIIPVPATLLRLLFGDMAKELLLSSSRVLPSRLQECGYAFRHSDLGEALRHVLGRQSPRPAARVARTAESA